MKKIAFIFPGQGSQFVGMAHDFVTTFQEAKYVFEEGNDILNRNLSKIVFEGPLELLTETKNSQTGIYLCSMAILRVLEKQYPSLKPILTSGLSLGEYTALTASGKLSFADTLPLIQCRGEWMNEACEMKKGTMAAIFGLSNEVLESIVEGIDDLWVANYNAPGQTVISGSDKGVAEGVEKAKAKGAKRAIPLQVHGAFHSGYMSYAKEKLEAKIREVSLKDSAIDIVMNVPGTAVKESTSIQNYLIEQVTSPVKWEQGIRSMQNIDLFIEIGCGRVLTGLNRQIGVNVPTINVSKITDLEELAKVLC